MNRKMREILAKIQEKTNEAKNMEDVEKASAIMDEVESMKLKKCQVDRVLRNL